MCGVETLCVRESRGEERRKMVLEISNGIRFQDPHYLVSDRRYVRVTHAPKASLGPYCIVILLFTLLNIDSLRLFAPPRLVVLCLRLCLRLTYGIEVLGGFLCGGTE